MPNNYDICGLDQEEFTRQLMDLRPFGDAWPDYGENSTQEKFWRSVAWLFDATNERNCQLVKEMTPIGAQQTLDDWEKQYGLPDPCLAKIDLTDEERREQIIAKIRGQGDLSIQSYKDILDALGFEYEIEEIRPYTCGISELGWGDELGPDEMRYWWQICIIGNKILYYRAGEAEAGDALTDFREPDYLACLLQKLKPAHTKLTFCYK